MDMTAIRNANLKAIRDWETGVNNEPVRGVSKVIANKLPKVPGNDSTKYIYQLLSGYQSDKDRRPRRPGDDLCRRLEQGYRLPANWMSQHHVDPVEEIKRFQAMRGRRRGSEGTQAPVTVWPFPGLDPSKVLNLSAINIGRLEGAMVNAAGQFGLDILNAAA